MQGNEIQVPTTGALLKRGLRRYQANDLEGARKAYGRVLRVEPDHYRALHLLGLVMFEAGHYKEAVKLIEKSIKIQADDHAYNDLGQIWIKLDTLDLAKACFQKAIELRPNNAFAINNLANCLKKAGDSHLALRLYRDAVELSPDNPVFLTNLGNLLSKTDQHEEAIAVLLRSVDLTDTPADVHCSIGLCQEQLGRFAEAEMRYRAAIDHKPHHARAVAALLALPTAPIDPAQEKVAKGIMADESIDAEKKTRVAYGLGKLLERKKSYDEAFFWYKCANEIQHPDPDAYDNDAVKGMVHALKKLYTSERIQKLSALGSESMRPVFIVGLPRTGTSLTEQIIASHPQTHGAGELRDLSHLVKKHLGGLSDLSNPKGFAARTKEALSSIANGYSEAIGLLAPKEAIRVVDKFPPNFLYVGLMSIVFPRATIIHCSRDIRDVALSCYTTAFRMDYDYTSDMRNFARYYSLYSGLMDHWHNALPNPPLRLVYEDLVHDPDTWIPRIIEHCRLEYDERCLHFHKTDRSVRTPSNWQVRQKLYTGSIGRWKHYEKHMQPLLDELAIQGLDQFSR